MPTLDISHQPGAYRRHIETYSARTESESRVRYDEIVARPVMGSSGGGGGLLLRRAFACSQNGRRRSASIGRATLISAAQGLARPAGCLHTVQTRIVAAPATRGRGWLGFRVARARPVWPWGTFGDTQLARGAAARTAPSRRPSHARRERACATTEKLRESRPRKPLRRYGDN